MLVQVNDDTFEVDPVAFAAICDASWPDNWARVVEWVEQHGVLFDEFDAENIEL